MIVLRNPQHKNTSTVHRKTVCDLRLLSRLSKYCIAFNSIHDAKLLFRLFEVLHPHYNSASQYFAILGQCKTVCDLRLLSRLSCVALYSMQCIMHNCFRLFQVLNLYYNSASQYFAILGNTWRVQNRVWLASVVQIVWFKRPNSSTSVSNIPHSHDDRQHGDGDESNMSDDNADADFDFDFDDDADANREFDRATQMIKLLTRQIIWSVIGNKRSKLKV